MLLFIVLPWYKGSQRKILTFVCVCISMGRYTYTYIHSKQEYCLKKGNSITNYCQVPVHICWYLLFVFKIPPVSSEDFPDSSVVKESACNAGDPGLIPGSGRSVGEGEAESVMRTRRGESWGHQSKVKVKGHSVVSDSLRPHGLCSPWNSPGQNTGEGSLSLLQGIFPTPGLNSGLPHCRWILYQLSHQGSPRILEWVAYPFSRGSF